MPKRSRKSINKTVDRVYINLSKHNNLEWCPCLRVILIGTFLIVGTVPQIIIAVLIIITTIIIRSTINTWNDRMSGEAQYTVTQAHATWTYRLKLSIRKQSIYIFNLSAATNTGVFITPEQTNAKTGRPGRLCYTGFNKASQCHITGSNGKTSFIQG